MSELGSAIIQYTPGEAQLVEMSNASNALTISGLDDRKGYALVHDARMKLKGVRVEIEKARVAFKAEALEYGRRVDSEAKRLTAIVEPAERALEAKEKAIDDEKARIQAEIVAKRKAKLDDRISRLAAIDIVGQPSKLEAMSDEDFERELGVATAAFEQRMAKEKAEAEERAELDHIERESQRKEAERLKAERAELDRIGNEQRAKEAADAERQRQIVQAHTDLERKQAEAAQEERQRVVRVEAEETARKQRIAQEDAARAARIEADERARVAQAEEAKRGTKQCPTCKGTGMVPQS